MDRKILRLALVIAVSLFVGTVFTGCEVSIGKQR